MPATSAARRLAVRSQGDPLGGMNLTPELYGHLTQRLARLAEGKLVLALEGGYNLRQTAECAAECAKVRLRDTSLKSGCLYLASTLLL